MTRVFSSEVDAGSCEENASKPESGAPFRFTRNGKGSSRRSVLRSIAGLAMLAPSGALRAATDSTDQTSSFRRGIGVSHAFGWADVAADGSYVVPPFSAPRFQFIAEERQAIRAAGFDFVRLAVDVGPFLAFTGTQRDQLDNLLINTVRDLLNTHLGVIVDMHPSSMNPAYQPSELTAGVNTPKFQALVALVRRLAGRLAQLAAEKTGQPKLRLKNRCVTKELYDVAKVFFG